MKKIIAFVFLSSLMAFSVPSFAGPKGSQCFAGQSGFCGCMNKQFDENCPMCNGNYGFLVNTITRQGIETTCAGNLGTNKGSDYKNCVEDLYCYIDGKTKNPEHPCNKKCSY